MKECRVYKRTTDDWCPSYRLSAGSYSWEAVEVSFLELHSDTEYNWRVCVWGSDDMGMEKDFKSYGEAKEMYIEVINLEFVNVQPLKQLGFISA